MRRSSVEMLIAILTLSPLVTAPISVFTITQGIVRVTRMHPTSDPKNCIMRKETAWDLDIS